MVSIRQKIILIVLCLFVFIPAGCVLGQGVYLEEERTSPRDVRFFDIQNLRLKMSLEQAKQQLQEPKIVEIRDELGLVNEYELTQYSGYKRVVLRFTGKKRLYRIKYVNYYKTFKNNAAGLFLRLQKKYGTPFLKRELPVEGGPGGNNIFACWGASCDNPTYTPYSPRLTATVYQLNGKIQILLADHTIHREDWNDYKQKRKEELLKKKENSEQNTRNKVDF